MVQNREGKVDVICPLYNGSSYIEDLYYSIKKQKNVEINDILFILTDTMDNSEIILKKIKANYEKIKKKEFSHSLTREKYALKSKAEIIVFITQDVIIKNDNWLYELVNPIINDEVDACFSRQLCDNNTIEKYTRELNYPEKSYINTKEDIDKKGLRTFFFSDASSAVYKNIFKEINGYDHKNLPISEDMYLAYKLIIGGYRIKYCSKSIVIHSHKFTLKQVYDRYKLTGKFFKENSYLDKYGTNKSGGGMAKYILKRAIQDKNVKVLVRYPFDMLARFIGMKVGKYSKI